MTKRTCSNPSLYPKMISDAAIGYINYQYEACFTCKHEECEGPERELDMQITEHGEIICIRYEKK